MHNWWIASLEHFGLITREEAEHMAANIKLAIHKDNYPEAYRELEAILGDGGLEGTPLIKQLRNDLEDLKDEVRSLKPIAKPNKA